MNDNLDDIFGPGEVTPAEPTKHINHMDDPTAVDYSQNINLNTNQPIPKQHDEEVKEPVETVTEEVVVESEPVEETVISLDDDIVEEVVEVKEESVTTVEEPKHEEPVVETVVKPEPVEEVTIHEVEEDNKSDDKVIEEETAEESIESIIQSEDGLEIITADDSYVVDDDINISVDAGKVYDAIYKTATKDDIVLKPFAYNKESKIPTPKAHKDNAVSMIKELMYYGEYMDVYLPISNVTVRVFEFETKNFLSDNYYRIQQWVEDRDYLNGIRSLTISKRIIESIKDNCVFLTKDGASLDTSSVIDQLSVYDINLLILATAALLVYVDNEKKNYNFSINAVCPHCGSNVRMDFDLLDMLRQQYNHMSDEEKNLRMNNYSMEETFMEKLNKSHHNTKIKASYEVGEGANKLTTTVYVMDPSYKLDLSMETEMYDYLLVKYADLVNYYTKDIYGYNNHNTKRKMALLVDAMQTANASGNISDDMFSFSADIYLCNVVPFINRIEFQRSNKDKSVYHTSSMTPAERLEVLRSLPDAMMTKINKAREIINAKVTESLKIHYECMNCKKETLSELPAINLFYYAVIQAATNNV